MLTCENFALFMHLHRPLALAKEIPTTGMMKVQLRWEKKSTELSKLSSEATRGKRGLVGTANQPRKHTKKRSVMRKDARRLSRLVGSFNIKPKFSREHLSQQQHAD